MLVSHHLAKDSPTTREHLAEEEWLHPHEKIEGPVWQGFGSSKNSSGSGFSDGAVFLVELEPF